MTGILVLKIMLASLMWSIVWCARFVHTNADVNVKNQCIAFAPWILMFFYFLFFWWG